jgi:hypothetical protein
MPASISGIVTSANAADEPSADPSKVFNYRLTEEVASLKSFLTPPSPTEKDLELADFPPHVEFLATLESLCGQLTEDRIEYEEAYRQFRRALIKRFDEANIFGLVLHMARKNFGETLAWPALGTAVYVDSTHRSHADPRRGANGRSG